ncbi:CPBP family intramembrane glutamic endopeptidase [Pasteuria penetrans]|uniref:CPBP family intramembrane glutamic endopeptidase n=1 Tax=Pasteuria penetrans TaxID=86005 RepID=UPI000FA8D3EA|nr:CPBP family intramembrane glutamic endopeptidase [Pasteuria penetrans]
MFELIIPFVLILPILFFVRFDRAYYQNMVLLGNSPHHSNFIFWGNKITSVFLMILYVCGALAGVFLPLNRFMYDILVFLYPLLGLLLVWTAFPERIMLKLGLNPQRYIHSTVVMFGVLQLISYVIGVVFSMVTFSKFVEKKYPYLGFLDFPIWVQVFAYGLILLYLLSGLFLVWPAFRKYVMLKLHLDPQRYIHRVAVWWMFYVFIKSLIVNSFFFPTLPRDVMSDVEFSRLLELCIDVITAILAVGGGVTRSWQETWARLGLNKKPTWAGFGVVIGLYFLLQAVSWYFLPDSDSESGPFPTLTWVGILLLGIGPGIGEELFFRGALQPRVGIWITSILFTLCHTQYEWNGLLDVFLGSLLLGWVARRYSIWLSIGIHILNNIVYAVFSYPGSPLFIAGG